MKLSSDLSSSIASNLSAAGMSSSEVNAKIELFGRAWSSLEARSSAVRMWWVPGRIELLGKHTDYAGGRSLLCAIDRGIVLMARPRRDSRLRVVDAVRGERIEFAPGERPAAPAWALYPAVVAERLARDFPG